MRRLLRWAVEQFVSFAARFAPNAFMSKSAITDLFERRAPHPQNAIDVFSGEWSSKFPKSVDVEAGDTELFNDPRMLWLEEQIGGFGGKRILELGPLEGAHTATLERLGAAEIVAVEANTRAYLKCLITKEILGLKRVRFLLGDALSFLNEIDDRFDVIIASGVFYHMEDPVALLAAMSERTDLLFLWTHYWDSDRAARDIDFAGRFLRTDEVESLGLPHRLHRHEYKRTFVWRGFPGGVGLSSSWMEKEEILRALEHVGFRHHVLGVDAPSHPNGPCFGVLAKRTEGDANQGPGGLVCSSNGSPLP